MQDSVPFLHTKDTSGCKPAQVSSHMKAAFTAPSLVFPPFGELMDRNILSSSMRSDVYSFPQTRMSV